MTDYADKSRYQNAGTRAEWRELGRWALRWLVALHIVAFYIGAIAFAQWVDDRAIDADIAAATATTAALTTVSLDGCPPPAPGMTQTVILTIRSIADDKPEVTGCYRIAERSFAERWRPR